MKVRTLAILGGIFLTLGLSAQNLTQVINEFNAGVALVNNQDYDGSLEHFNKVLELADVVGDSAAEMLTNAQTQIPLAYYRQAMLFLKRKQYDNAIPCLENTIQSATEFDNNSEQKGKSQRYLLQSYMMEGQRNYKNQNWDASVKFYDKALGMNGKLYKAHLGKALVFKAQDETDMMLEEFALAKEGALAKNDTKTIASVNKGVDSYYNSIIKEEFDAIDIEEPDYEYVVEASENALNANPDNPRALYYMAAVSNKKIEYDPAVEYALKGLQFETEPIFISALNLELGHAYQNSAEYDKACEALQKVTEDPFLGRAEKKISVIGCN